MNKSVAEWLDEGSNLFEVGLAECRAIDARIAQLQRLRADQWAALQQMARTLGRPAADASPDAAPRPSRRAATPSNTSTAIAAAIGG